jgi:hypothetical protein
MRESIGLSKPATANDCSSPDFEVAKANGSSGSGRGRGGEAVILDTATDAVEAMEVGTVDADDANSAFDGEHPLRRQRRVRLNLERTIGDIARRKCGIQAAVEAVAAEVLGLRRQRFRNARPMELHRPMDARPVTPAAVSLAGWC